MKRRLLVLFLATALLLTGCGWFNGSYVNVTPYQQQSGTGQTGAVSARNYYQLRSAMEEMISTGTEAGVINVAGYENIVVERNLKDAITYVLESYPVGAYAVEAIDYEVGTSSGKPAIALEFTYRRSRNEIRRIQKVKNIAKAADAVEDALRDFDNVLVLEVEEYTATDFVQMVEAYGEAHPEFVMEAPVVTVDVWGKGRTRVVELSFSYQTNRDSLKQMKTQVQPMFDASSLYVSSAGEDRQKFSQLYSFLMERFDYTLETSLTPAYSLLCHGVGDSRAFAMVYASMCRRAGLECQIVTGTRNGEPWTWNMVCDNGNYYHVDLLRSSASSAFQELLDREMSGYVWDYSAYPECVNNYGQPADPIPTEETTEVTDP